MADMIESGVALLKTDAVGRVKTPPERRESLLDEFARSGLSGKKFAELAGIKYQTFAAWVTRRRKQHGETQPAMKPSDPMRWLQAVVTEAATPTAHAYSPVKIKLPTGAWIELCEPKQIDLVAALVQALEKPLPAC